MFAVLEFMNSDNEPAGEISIVPINWLRKNDTKCYWPTTTKRRNFSDFVKDETPYKSSWPCYKVYKVHLKTASYEHAEEMIEKLIANSIQSDSSSLSVTSNRSFMVKKVASKLDISSSSDSPSPRSSSKNRTQVEQTADVNLHTPKITTHNAYAKPVTPIRPATPISSDDEFFNQNLDRSNIQDTSVQNLSPIQNQNKSDTTNKKRFYNLDSETPRTKRVATPNDEAPTSDQNKINHRNINYSSDNLSTATTVTNASFSSERSLEEVARHLSDIKNTLAQHSIMLNVLQNQAQLTNSGSLIPPPDLPDFPLKTFESFKQFEQSLQEDEAVRNYMIHRLAAIGGSGLDGLVRRILKFLISNEVAVLFNWKGREKHSLQTTKVMDIIYSPRNLKFQPKWFSSFSWLVYTQAEGSGALCKCCAIFAKEAAGKGESQKLSALVKKPFNNWKNAIDVFNHHSNLNYHKKCVLLADNFIKVYSKAKPNIIESIVTNRQQQVQENREKLLPIIEVIKLCGRQELALRGTSDSGEMNLAEEVTAVNEGNFRAILRMRVNSGDNILKNHLEKSCKNAKYISPGIQNELIAICGKIIQETIVKEVKGAGLFSVLADETTGVSRTEQMTLCVRYVSTDNEKRHFVKEQFLGFTPVTDATGKGLATLIIKYLQELGLDCQNLVGQGYDGAAAMSGNFNGVQAEIKKMFPYALYVHCSSHSLNLAIGHCCSVQSVRNCIGTVKSIGNFIKISAKRTAILKQKIQEYCPQTKWTKLTSMCDTRWVENHNGLIRFKEIYKPIVECLETLSEEVDAETSSKASQLLAAIISSEFVISLCVAETLFSYTVSLCKMLQTVNCDLPSAIGFVENVKNTIAAMRTDMENTFSLIFNNAKSMPESVGETVVTPRVTNRQKHRVNVPQKTPEEYYRISVAIPFFDDS